MDKTTYRVILVTRNYYNKTKFKKDVLYYLYKRGQIRGANINNFDNHGARCVEFIHE
jgi:hypothetical protein